MGVSATLVKKKLLPTTSSLFFPVTDSPVRLVDIDKDGRLDIIIAMSSSHVTKEGESFKECPLKGKIPCILFL